MFQIRLAFGSRSLTGSYSLQPYKANLGWFGVVLLHRDDEEDRTFVCGGASALGKDAKGSADDVRISTVDAPRLILILQIPARGFHPVRGIKRSNLLGSQSGAVRDPIRLIDLATLARSTALDQRLNPELYGDWQIDRLLLRPLDRRHLAP